jgi:glycosyltransferase involved in cell wall biosynthesis
VGQTAPLRIGFDARLAGPSHTGIGRYGQELLTRFLKVKTLKNHPVRWVVFVDAISDTSWLDIREFPGVEFRRVQIPHYGLKEQTLWVKELLDAKLDLLYVPHFNVPVAYPGRYVMTLHDLLWHNQHDSRATTLPAWQYAFKRLAYKFVSEQAVRRACAVIVPTKAVAKDVKQLIHREKDVFVLSEGIPELYRKAKISTEKSDERYCVYTGNLYPHKNFITLLRALQLDGKMKLKVVGARSVFMDESKKTAQELGVEKQIEWLGFVSDDELIPLYQGAVALIQPSLAEGFGLTGLEALAVGCPIAVSEIPVFREVYGDRAHYFPALSAEALSSTWRVLVVDPPKKKERESYKEYALTFDWDNVSEKALEIFSKTLV